MKISRAVTNIVASTLLFICSLRADRDPFLDFQEQQKSMSQFENTEELWSAATYPPIAQGLRLPEEYTRFSILHHIPTDSVWEDKMKSVSKSVRSLIEQGKPEQIPALFIEDANQLPPTRSDLANLMGALQGFNIMTEFEGKYVGTEPGDWNVLADAKNPIYRFIALRGIGVSVPKEYQQYVTSYPHMNIGIYFLSANERFDSYKLFFEESDPYISGVLYGALGRVPIEESRAFLMERKKRYEEEGDAVQLRGIKDSIEYLDSLIDSKPDSLFYPDSQGQYNFKPYQPDANSVSPRKEPQQSAPQKRKSIEDESPEQPEINISIWLFGVAILVTLLAIFILKASKSKSRP